MKRLLIGTTALLFSTISKAQTFTIGLTGGGGESWILNYVSGATTNTAWNAGASFTYRNKSHIGLGADVLYSAEGATYAYLTEPAGSIKETLNTNYIRVPLKVIYFFGKEKSIIHPYINAGPSFGVLMPTQSILNSNDVKTVFNTKQVINNFDAGINAAAGLNVKLTPKIFLNANLAYYCGIRDVIKNDVYKNYNENLQFNLGVQIALKK